MRISLASVVNNNDILNHTLLSSPDIHHFHTLYFQREYSSASKAFNDVIDATDSDIIVFLHQDIYLPAGWYGNLLSSINWLNSQSINWGVLGLYGCNYDGSGVGYLYSTGLGRFIGKPILIPTSIRTLDEVLLVVNCRNKLRFDSNLSGFHFYGTDICLEAEKNNLLCFSIPAFVIHNSSGYNYLPFDYWKSYMYMRNKWSNELPIYNPCTVISRFCFPVIKAAFSSLPYLCFKSRPINRRTHKPAILYDSLGYK